MEHSYQSGYPPAGRARRYQSQHHDDNPDYQIYSVGKLIWPKSTRLPHPVEIFLMLIFFPLYATIACTLGCKVLIENSDGPQTETQDQPPSIQLLVFATSLVSEYLNLVFIWVMSTVINAYGYEHGARPCFIVLLALLSAGSVPLTWSIVLQFEKFLVSTPPVLRMGDAVLIGITGTGILLSVGFPVFLWRRWCSHRQ
ncbi:hypothetical protein BDN72DRAFT_840081 [Pluteus cervinus]|uniref:Uncharacterized protein n=1 Tax=Pluteus cervinus TaxID=181527 RepID=A0ACD3AUP4_9AGAR|nr:hypothetical protein BDN72DRAFT_840081 [Pluteus cervinus]